MKKVWEVYKRDLKKISRNVFAAIITVGIILIPALYAWFNIDSNWDPYSNTKGIKIAVANMDEGSELDGLKINIGGMIIEKLATNNQIGWQFVDRKQALEGVDDSEYYAALIIPEDFSKDMLSIANLDVKQPVIDYYVNEKKNAIAPKITNAGVNTVQLQVNEAFIETASSVLSSIVKNVSTKMEDQGAETIGKVIDTLGEAKSSLEGYKTLLTSITASAKALDSAISAVGSLRLDTDAIQDNLDNAAGEVDETDYTLQALLSSLTSVMGSISAEIGNSQTAVSNIQTDLENNRDGVIDSMNTALKGLEKTESLNSSLLSALENLQSSLLFPISGLQDLIDKVSDNETRLQNAISDLNSSIESVKAGESLPARTIESAQKALSGIADIQNEVQDLFQNQVQDDLASLNESINEKIIMASGLVNGAAEAQQGIDSAITATRVTLEQSTITLDQSRELLQKGIDKLDHIMRDLQNSSADESLQKLGDLLSRDPAIISSFLKKPVSLNQHSVYKIENYGSGMAPFYTTLALWVGALVNVAILKTKIKDEEEFGGLSPAQAYFGRYLIFMTVSILQALVICLGDLYILHIQCLNPGLFILAGVAAAITFSLLMYTLTISFGDVGKALAVILMVVQVAGSGGTFPIETLPQFYQNLYPFFPFNFAINAMRECVAGMYGNYYWLALSRMIWWILASLFIGLVLRKPIIRLKEYVEEKVEETGLMG